MTYSKSNSRPTCNNVYTCNNNSITNKKYSKYNNNNGHYKALLLRPPLGLIPSCRLSVMVAILGSTVTIIIIMMIVQSTVSKVNTLETHKIMK